MARRNEPKRGAVVIAFDKNGVNTAAFLDMLRYDGARVIRATRLPDDTDRYARPTFNIVLEADSFETRRWASMGFEIITEGVY